VVNGLNSRARDGAGIDESVVYDQRSVMLNAGDLILFYTDGVTDALDVQGREFGLDRLRRMVLDHRDASAKALAETLDRALAEFGGAVRYDDITVVIARRLYSHDEPGTRP